MLEKPKQKELADFIKDGQSSEIFENVQNLLEEVDELFIALLLGKLKSRKTVVDFCDGKNVKSLIQDCAKEFGISEINMNGLLEVKNMISLQQLQEVLSLGYVTGY